MATIENYIRLRDGFSPVLERISRVSNSVADKLEQVSSSAIRAGNAAEQASSKFSMLKSIFAGSFLAGAALQGMEAIGNGLNNLVATADEYAGIQARLGLIAGSQENVAYLNQMIYDSAQRARGGYLDMAKAVAQLSMSAHDAFPDPREATTFMEGIQKLFVVGGTSKENQRDAMIQLTQGLASGQLQGDEFRSIAENAPIIEDIIAKQIGVPKGALKQLAAEGQLTADVIRDAILNNMDEINAQFDAMPKRWGDHFTELSNVATRSFAPVFAELNNLANSQSVRILVNNIAWAIGAVAPYFFGLIRIIEWFVDTTVAGIQYIGDFFNANAWAAEAVLGALGLALLYVGLQALVSAGQMGIAAAITAAKAVADWAETAALIAMTFAQEGLNAALAACPLTWIIGLIVVLIGVFYLAVAAVNYFAGTSISATGLIFGAFAFLGTGVMNIIKFLWNGFVAFANFLGSVFQDPLGAAYNLFVDIWNAIVGYVESAVNSIIDLVNKIPGMDKIGDFDHVAMPAVARKEIANAAFHLDAATYGDAMENAEAAYDIGAADWGQNIQEAVEKVMPGVNSPYDTSKKIPAGAYNPLAGGANAANAANGKQTADNTGRIADNTERIADKLDMTDADIKELRDAAMQETLNQWQSQNIVIHMENNNTISSDVDIDGMTSNLVSGLKEALAIKRAGKGEV